MFAMIDHLSGHAAVDADIFTGDESGFVRTEEQYHVGDIQRIANASCGLLDGVRAVIDGKVRVDPTGRDGVDAHLTAETDRQCVRKRGDTALGGGIAFALRLAHAVAA